MAFVLCTGTEPILTHTRRLILERAGHVVVITFREDEIRNACQRHRFDVAVIGHSSDDMSKQRWLALIRALCSTVKVLEVYSSLSTKTLPGADDWIESSSVSSQLADRVSALAVKKKEKARAA